MMRLPQILAAGAVCLLLAGCTGVSWTAPKKADDRLTLKESSFHQLPGWNSDAQKQALVPLRKSCARVLKKDSGAGFGIGGFAGTSAAWQDICRKLAGAPPPTDAEARRFFEDHFTPYEVWGVKGRDGLFTGYYEPILRGSFKRHKPFLIPIYGRPADLISVNLGDFRPELKGETLMGRVEKKKLVPYYKRTEIEKGALKKKHAEIVWVDGAVDAFFLHIQGSGQIRMDNGRIVRVGYAAQNGQPYTAIGREMMRQGFLEKGNVSMQSIRDWLEKNPGRAADVMNLNTSYIFFNRLKKGDGPLGAEGVPLTPRRSLAVDRKKIPYGVPVWLDADEPDGKDRLQRLMIAQDTGGAITGAVRGDFFWGSGKEAAHKAGLMKSKGRSWILLPKSVQVPEEKIRISDPGYNQ
ncbi:MAG: MltA domain-containing protein [Pseudomonadota bacterium]